ncbi:MAG: amino acid permease [Gemmatimonas sp. SG8_23]|nr:MAG: amino acid permease [Gemmatimonas sp. SG8_23]
MSTSHPSALPRVVGLSGAVWLGLGSILGTGVFVSLGIAAGVAGDGIVVAVGLAALVATANGLSSAQLAAAHPVSGGTYEYGRRFVHPSVGFAAGWMFLAAKSASAATAALGFAGYLLHTADLTDDVRARIAVALGLVLVLTLLVAGGLRRSNAVNVVIVSTTLLALAAFVAFGVAFAGSGGMAAAVGPPAARVALASPGALLHATALMFVAYTGYGRIATLGEEVREPARTIPMAVVVTLAVTMVLYVSVASTAVAAVGAEAFAAATAQAAAPLEVVARSFGPRALPVFIGLGAISAMAGVLLNLVLGLSRVVLAMARQGDVPDGLGRVDPDRGSPTRAVGLVGLIIALLVLVGDLRVTWSFSAFTVLVYYGITNLAALRLPAADRRFPRWIAVCGLTSCFGLAFFVPRPIWAAGLGLLVAGFGVRAVLRRAAPPGPGVERP